MNSWLILIVAAIFEIVWAVGLKSTHGFTKLWPSVGVIAAMATSMWLLALAARGLPIGTAYAVWVGIGALGAALLGWRLLDEPMSVARVICLCLLVAGIIGLKLTSSSP